MIDWIQNWFLEQCDGNWEHEQVIKIESLDNPGWNVEIDFNNTSIHIEEDVPYKLFDKGDNNWIGYEIKDNVFHCAGDALKLKLILEIFKQLAVNHRINEQEILINLK